jgi:hypothetical protein
MTRTSFSLAVVFLGLFAVVLPVVYADTKANDTGGPAPLTEAMRAAFGAATIIPDDASYFSSTFRLREQWDAIVNSRAVRKILELPGAVMLQQQILQSPQYQSFELLRGADPLLARVLETLVDAVSHEVFFYADSRLSPTVEALWRVYSSAFLPDTLGYETTLLPGVRRAVDLALELEDELQVPGIVAGFALSDPDAGRQILTDLMRRLTNEGPPLPIFDWKIENTQYYTLLLGGRMVPKDARSAVADALSDGDFSSQDIARVRDFLSSRTLALSVGVRGKYLLVSIGRDNEHLRRLGTEASLVASTHLAPVREHFKSDVIGLVYTAKELSFGTTLSREDTSQWIDEMLKAIPPEKISDELATRLKADAGRFIDDVNSQVPEPSPYVSVSFKNRGIETLSFSGEDSSGVDTSKPLTLLAHVGKKPLAFLASRSTKFAHQYDLFARWVGVAKDYFDKIVVPHLSADDQTEYQRFHDIFVPSLREIDVTTREYLLPAVDGLQSALIVDSAGKLPTLPATPLVFSKPLRIPRPAIVFEVNDAEKFKEAFARYRRSINDFLKHVAETDIGLEPFEIPKPESSPFAGGTKYHYDLPIEVSDGFEPHVVVSEKLVILSLYPRQTKSILKSSEQPTDAVVDLASSAGVAYKVNLRRLVNLVLGDVGIAVETLSTAGQFPPMVSGLVGAHLPAVREALGTFRSFTGRIYTGGDHLVHHSWLRVVDIEDRAE